MSRITTHVLDTSRGKPAAAVEVTLERADGSGAWAKLSSARTDANGRIAEFPGAGELRAGTHRLRFDTAAYFAGHGIAPFFTTIELVFEVRAPHEHHHVPVLITPFGYTTYRGS